MLVPEVNLGQLRKLVRAEFLVDAQGLNKVNGLPFRRVDVELANFHSAPATLWGGRQGNGGQRPPGGGTMTDVAVPVTTRKDWTSDQEVRWCPGCGDYSILTAVQLLMPELGVPSGRTRCSCRASAARAVSRTT